MKIVVSRMAQGRHAGDWHDAPLRWEAVGPGNEVQQFSRKIDALLYARIRRKAVDFNAACRAFVLA